MGGEAWSVYSFVELAGVVVLVTGQAIYAGVLQVPGLNYAASPPGSPQKENFVSPGAMKLNSPCLPEPDSDDQDDLTIKLIEEEAHVNGKHIHRTNGAKTNGCH